MAGTIENQQENEDFNPDGKGFNFDKFDENKRKFLKALAATMGHITEAARRVGMSRAIHYVWEKEDPEYAKAFEDIKESQLDFGEHQLFKAMRNENAQCITFFLRTKGKTRGYMEQNTMIEIDKIERATIQLPGGSIDI